jgi:hypothetical protein
VKNYRGLQRLVFRLRGKASRDRDPEFRVLYANDARRVEAIIRNIHLRRQGRVRHLVIDSDTALRDQMPARLVSWAWEGGRR